MPDPMDPDDGRPTIGTFFRDFVYLIVAVVVIAIGTAIYFIARH